MNTQADLSYLFAHRVKMDMSSQSLPDDAVVRYVKIKSIIHGVSGDTRAAWHALENNSQLTKSQIVEWLDNHVLHDDLIRDHYKLPELKLEGGIEIKSVELTDTIPPIYGENIKPFSAMYEASFNTITPEIRAANMKLIQDGILHRMNEDLSVNLHNITHHLGENNATYVKEQLLALANRIKIAADELPAAPTLDADTTLNGKGDDTTVTEFVLLELSYCDGDGSRTTDLFSFVNDERITRSEFELWLDNHFPTSEIVAKHYELPNLADLDDEDDPTDGVKHCYMELLSSQFTDESSDYATASGIPFSTIYHAAIKHSETVQQAYAELMLS